jgi:hypothetical protein
MSLTSTRRVKSRSTPQRTTTHGRMLVLGFVAAGAFGTVALETSSNANMIADRLASFEKSWPTTVSKSMTAIAASVASKTTAPTTGTKIAAAVEQPETVVAVANASSGESIPALSELNGAGTAPPVAAATGRGVSGSVFQIGDQLKIAFYEQADLQDDRWAKARSARPSLQQRTELTGEYAVQPDGSIADRKRLDFG